MCLASTVLSMRVHTVLPVEVEDSPGLVAGEELVAEQGSAGWPVSCAETGAGSAGMQVGSPLVTHKMNNHQQESKLNQVYAGNQEILDASIPCHAYMTSSFCKNTSHLANLVVFYTCRNRN